MNEPNKIALFVQGSFVKVTVAGQERNQSKTRRNVVTGFSAASRLRLLQKMATIKRKRGFKAIFITLTYGQRFPSPAEAKTHLDTLLKRLHRKYPMTSAFWRFDFQKRGAPHFHLIAFNLPYLPQADLKRAWGEIVGREYWDTSDYEPEEPFTQVDLIRSHRKAMSYVSKYVARDNSAVGAGGFNYVPYLTDGIFFHPQTGMATGSIGRWWGVFNGAALPVADGQLILIPCHDYRTAYDIVEALRRGMSSVWAGVNNTAGGGWSLFCDNPSTWIDYAEELIAYHQERERCLS